jgi:outer membrane receptor protein involved in Fe transport
VAHFGGEHTLAVGYKLELPHYDPFKNRSGGRFDIPATNIDGAPYLSPAQSYVLGNTTNAQFRLRVRDAAVGVANCDICPVMSVPGFAAPVHVALQEIRGEFGPNDIHTEGTYHAAFLNDSWTLNKHVTVNAGVRWEQQHLQGDTLSYTFTDNWSPRFGVSTTPRVIVRPSCMRTSDATTTRSLWISQNVRCPTNSITPVRGLHPRSRLLMGFVQYRSGAMGRSR